MATLRYRFERLGAFRGGLGGQIDAADQEPLASGALAVTGTATSSGAQPVAPALTDGCFVKLVAIDAPLYVDIAASPDPTVEPRLLVLPGAPERVHVGSGVKISAILAVEVVTTLPTQDQPLATNLVDRSGTVTSGGSAQQACAANAARRLLVLANPDETRTLWFNTTGTAVNGAGSMQAGPGGAFVFDKIVPAGAVSVFGPAAGQPFTVKEA